MLRVVTDQNMNRTLTRDVELHGEKLHGASACRSYPPATATSAFSRPDRFDVTRARPTVTSHSRLRHALLLGASLARLELRVLFEPCCALPDIELASDALPLRPSNFIVGIERCRFAYARESMPSSTRTARVGARRTRAARRAALRTHRRRAARSDGRRRDQRRRSRTPRRSTFAEIERAFAAYKVISATRTFDRESPRARARFGELEEHPFIPAKPGYQKIVQFRRTSA
jgi:hypothetical protein